MRVACAARGLEAGPLGTRGYGRVRVAPVQRAAPGQRRAVLVMASGFLLMALLPERAAAQGTQPITTKSGVQFSLPMSLRPTAAPAGVSNSKYAIEQVFSDGAAQPLQLFVVNGPPLAGRVLPPNTEQARQDLTNGFVEGARPLLKNLTLQHAALGEYDPARGAFALTLAATGPSRAHRMLSEPDDGPVWAAVRKSGEDPGLLRCFMTQLLAGAQFADEARLRANSSAAAEHCSVPLQRIERFLANVDRAAFGPTAITLASVALFTRFATVSLLVLAATERKQDVEALATLIWSSASARPDARIESAPDALSSSPLASGRLIGVVLGSLLAIVTLGGALAWLLFKWLRLSAATAVGGAFAALNALVVLSLVLRRDAVGIQHWLQLGAYALGSVLLYRPMTKWLAARGSASAPERHSTGSQP